MVTVLPSISDSKMFSLLGSNLILYLYKYHTTNRKSSASASPTVPNPHGSVGALGCPKYQLSQCGAINITSVLAPAMNLWLLKHTPYRLILTGF